MKLQSLLFSDSDDDAKKLRSINLVAVFGLLWAVRGLVSHLSGLSDEEAQINDKQESQSLNGGSALGNGSRVNGRLTHIVVNVLLFPPLFFFYGLYYTDVFSVLSVLLTYLLHVQKRRIWVIVAGLVSLGFRQTNVFWVGIYLGGLELQRMLPRGSIERDLSSEASIWNVLCSSWTSGCVHDPLLKEASFEGMIALLDKM